MVVGLHSDLDLVAHHLTGRVELDLVVRPGRSVEAVMAENPVLFGPHMENFRALVERFEAAGGTRQVADAEALRDAVLGLLERPELGEKMVARARGVLSGHDGATARTAEILLAQ